MSEPQRRRRRPAMSCNLCRQRKIRCNREVPCSNCIRSRNQSCEYENLPTLPHRPRESELEQSSSTTQATTTPISEIELLGSRIKYLENRLESTISRSSLSVPPTPSTAATPVSSVETAESRIGGTFYIHHGDPALGQSPKIHRNITHKKRMYGQSHWMNLSLTLVKDIAQMIDMHSRDPNSKESCEKVFIGMKKCKQMAKAVKLQREPPWPCVPTPDLPPKQVADELVNCYLGTYESVYRILHIPSFTRSYEAVWSAETEVDPTFVVQLKLVMAIGSASYDDYFTLRPSAMRWVHEAETWIANPHLKHRINLQYLQISCLQLLAREVASVGEDMVYISAGSLLRSAIFLGLHRDPIHLPARTLYANEMHRRLWSTILEVCLQTSLCSGCPPLICMDDFDTQPPGNFDDDQLELDDSSPRPEQIMTKSSVSAVLRRSFPVRLAVARSLNNFVSSGTYDETIRLDSELRQMYKEVRSTLRGFDSSSSTVLSDFQLRAVETIMNRYLCALHSPFFTPSLSDAKYTYSRKTVFETAKKMWYTVYPVSEKTSSPILDSGQPEMRDAFQRVVSCGQGFFRSAALQSVLMIAIEMNTQFQEDDSLGPKPLRQDLFAILEGAEKWSLWCMKAGETNVKGHVFTSLMLAHARGLAEGLSTKEIAKSLVEAVGSAEDEGMKVLEKMLEHGWSEQDQTGLPALSLDFFPGMLPGWESIMPDDMVVDGYGHGFDPMNWSSEQANMQTTWLF